MFKLLPLENGYDDNGAVVSDHSSEYPVPCCPQSKSGISIDKNTRKLSSLSRNDQSRLLVAATRDLEPQSDFEDTSTSIPDPYTPRIRLNPDVSAPVAVEAVSEEHQYRYRRARAAITWLDLNIVCNMMDAQYSINTYDENGVTLLFHAFFGKAFSIARFLVQHGANYLLCSNLRDKDRGSDLIHFMLDNQMRLTDCCDRKYDLSSSIREIVSIPGKDWLQSRDTPSRLKPFERAVKMNSPDLIASLINAGAKASSTTAFTLSILQSAALTSSDNKIIYQLFSVGARVNQIDGDDTTPLHYAVEADDAHTAYWLLQTGADVDAANRDGVTPLHLASFREILELLLKHKPRVTCTQPWRVELTGRRFGHLLKTINARSTPLHVAAGDYCKPELVRLLLGYMSWDLIWMKDVRGLTALSIAEKEQNRSAINMLRFCLAEGCPPPVFRGINYCMDRDSSLGAGLMAA